MNPFAILHALVTALEAVNPKRRQETKREQRRFLFWYFLFLFLAVAVVGSIIYELYFAK